MQASAIASARGIDSEFLDQDSLVERCMGNHALVQRLLTRYMDVVSQECDLLDTALRGEDPRSLAQVAHRLKGASATIGSSRTCELATLIEQESAAADWPLLSSIVAEIRDVHASVTQHYRESLSSYPRVVNCGDGE